MCFLKVLYVWFAVSLLGVTLANAQTARTVYIDVANNDGPANWNNVAFSVLGTSKLLNDSLTNATGIRATVTTRLNGLNSNATASPTGDAAEFEPASTNSVYGHTATFSGTAPILLGQMAFSNMNPNVAYTFTFYASRMGVSDVRESRFTVTGANSGYADLNASTNSSKVATVADIYPDAAGVAVLRVEQGPNNANSPYFFFYLTAMKVDYVEPPAPPAQELTTVYVDAAGSAAASGWNLAGFNALSDVWLTDATNGVTGMRLQVTRALNSGLNGDATSSPVDDAAEFKPSGTQNAYGLNNSYGTALLSGLATNAAYTFTFYASRTNVTDNREALYTVTGANSGQGVLDASSNTSRVAVVTDILPAADGTISLRLEKGSANNNSSGYFYLNAFKITYPAGASGGSVNPQEPAKRLLFFGNSFSLVDDVPGHVRSIAAIAGHPAPLVVADLMGGMDLAYHITQVDGYPENNVTNTALAGTNTWDHVIIQGYSTEATALRDAMVFRTNALALFLRVRDHASGKGAGVQPVLYQTWARAQGHIFYPDTFPDPAEMQNQIRTNYQAAADLILQEDPGTDLRLARVGDAFELDDFSPTDLYASDLYHAGNLGPRLAALILYKAIYGATVTNIPYAAVKAAGWTTMNSNDWTRVTYWAEGLIPPEVPVTTNPPPAKPGYGTREVYLLDAASGDAAALPGWNALALNAAGSTTLVLTNGYETDVTCSVVTRMNSVNTSSSSSPTGDASVFKPAGPNNAYGNVNPFNSYSNSHALVRFSGLNPARRYTFTCYASRMSATDCRETLYTASGANSATALLDAANNSTEVAVLSEISPQEDGTVELRIEPGPNNTSASLFYHLTALKIESVRRGFLFLIGP